ncbi:acyl-CoA thioesterase [Prauserella cavernicola]|uniref:Acyl-CoA thioesterase n=1 Tax=Prauserella cavernicola TaxID=2800127 RepID=A0A934QQK3_9PSEU|nr:thioesterase family protein [Prauserella cavernicola]MBK1784911.1 acyl-CoA thioesterase [Prauserella cavernicola]
MTFAHWELIATRWRDNDVYGHVNNVVYYEFMDTTVNRWLISEGGLDIHQGPMIGLCVESHCNYRAAAEFPEKLAIGLRVGRLGTSSVRYELGIHREDRSELLAEGHFVHVFVDRHSRRPEPITEDLRAALERLQIESIKD